MENNLRANFILHVITNKYIKCVQEKIEFSSMLQRQMLIYRKILRDVSLATKIKQQHKIARKLLRGSVQFSSVQFSSVQFSSVHFILKFHYIQKAIIVK